jgi:hypothetical protein
MEYIAFDAHKHYTLASVVRPDGQLVREQRLAHERGAFQQFLVRCEPGSPVALETVGNWYWIVDEIEGAGCLPKLVHARKAKLMMGMIIDSCIKNAISLSADVHGTSMRCVPRARRRSWRHGADVRWRCWTRAGRWMRSGASLGVRRVLSCGGSVGFADTARPGWRFAPRPGGPPKLRPGERRRLVQLLLKGALAHGYRTDLWTTARIAQVIKRDFRVQ